MDVVDLQQHGRLLAEAFNHPEESLEQARPRDRLVCRPLARHGRAGSTELRHEPRELAPTASEQLIKGSGLELTHQLP
jgi:hypothetical protein